MPLSKVKLRTVLRKIFFFLVSSCSAYNISFIVVLDSSSKSSSTFLDFFNNFAAEKNFAKEFIVQSDLGTNNNVQVAVVNFGSAANIASPCGNLTTKEQFFDFVNTLPMQYGEAAINGALLKAREAYQGCKRLNVKPVVIFLTYSKETAELDLNVKLETENLVKKEALLFTVTLGSDVNETDIMRMSKYVINDEEWPSKTILSSYAFPEYDRILKRICLRK